MGSWLPSVREFAARLGVNRNTVSKAYQAMARDGLIQRVNGRGVRVIGVKAGGLSSEARLSQQLEAVARDAHFAGLSRDWLVGRMREVSEEVYATTSLQIGFIECTELAANSLAKDIGRHLTMEVAPLVLSDVLTAPAKALRGLDLLTTTLFHLAEISEVAAASGVETVGINHAVSHESALAIARVKHGATLAVVVSTEQSLQKLLSTVQAYSRGEVRSCLSSDRAGLRRVLADADVVIDLPNTHATVKRERPDVETITVEFHIEPHSLDRLREVVRRRSERAATA